MRKLDLYILKKYFNSFFLILLILIPIAIAIDISEKAEKFSRHPDLPVFEIIRDYYTPFIVFYGNSFLPLALFISTILFTSQLANKTEIVAIHSAGISFKRFLKPYFIGATIIALGTLFANHFIVPKTNGTFEEFQENYLRKRKRAKNYVNDVNLQLSDNEFVYFRSFNFDRNSGYDFSFERFNGRKLEYKLTAKNIAFKDTIYTLSTVSKRFIGEKNDSIYKERKMDTVFSFKPGDLLYVGYIAKAMNSVDLRQHIKKSSNRGVKNLNQYKVELYRRTSMPVSTFILTIIAVSLSSKKRRGGIGINLVSGISLAFIYVFLMKVSEVLGSTATANSLLMVWMPNILFGILAVYLYRNASR